MDPFSVVVGAVALTEVANKLAGTLTDRYKAFSSAPKQMIEIAGQITLCAGLVDVFAKSVDGSVGVFPRKFEQDAASLVKQCRSILKEIDEMIPSGSKKPDYQQRLKYAFRDEKKIVKHQDRLKQVQHMFMFMTTCWMYQLPAPHTGQQPKEPVGSTSFGATGVSGVSGVSEGLTVQPPMQFSLKGIGGVNGNENYEATLTLTPIWPLDGNDRPTREGAHARTSEKPKKATISNRQKDSLENMRRSPYFSMSLLKSPVEMERRYQSTGPPLWVRPSLTQEEKSKAEEIKVEEEKKKLLLEKKEKGEEKREFEPVSKQQAEKDVGKIISGWFSGESPGNDPSSIPPAATEPYNKPFRPTNMDDEIFRTTSTIPPPSTEPYNNPFSPIIKDSYLTTPTSPRPAMPGTSSYTPTSGGSNYPSYADSFHPNSAKSPSPSSSTTPPIVRVLEDWDWRCDGCKKNFYYHQLRFKCQDCSNFDFCPQCYPKVWHHHPTSRFVERSV